MKFRITKSMAGGFKYRLVVLQVFLLAINPQISFGQIPSSVPVVFGPQSQEQVMVHTDKPYYLTGETLWFTAYCTNRERGSLSEISSVIYLEIFDETKKPISQVASRLDGGIATGQVFLSSNLSTGTYLLRAYTSWMKNGNLDDFYHQEISIINPLTTLKTSQLALDSKGRASESITASGKTDTAGPIQITTDQKIYDIRESVDLEIKSLGDNFLHASNLSISVYPFHQSLEWEPIEAPSRAQINNTQTNLRYLPEMVGPIVYGRSSDGTSVDQLMLSTAGNSTRVYQVTKRGSNDFAVQLTREADYQRLYFWTTDQKKPVISLRPVFEPRLPLDSLDDARFDSTTVDFIENQSVNMQVSNLYLEYNDIHGQDASQKRPQVPFYGYPEFRYHLDDYTRFPGLEEVFREFVKFVSLRKKSGIIEMYVWDHYSNDQSIANNMFFDRPALILLDGIPIYNMEWLLEQDPLRIKTIEVVTKKYLVGSKAFYGAVNLISYDGEFNRRELPQELEIIDFPDLQKPLLFQHPEYTGDAMQSRIPDRRNTLFWHPKANVSSEKPAVLRFYTGDVSGEYQIVVKGITSDGQVIYQTKRFSVIGGTAQ